MSATAFYGYLAFPVHERPSYVVRTREGKVVVPDVEIRRGSLHLVPIYPADPRPVYQQLADSLRARILSGELPPGSLLRRVPREHITLPLTVACQLQKRWLAQR